MDSEYPSVRNGASGEGQLLRRSNFKLQGRVCDIPRSPHEFSKIAADQLALDGNYPNPFRGQTHIQFALPEATEITVSVYDITGRKVATLLSQSLVAGSHIVLWNGRSNGRQELSSGVYFVRVEAGAFSQVRRITIVR